MKDDIGILETQAQTSIQIKLIHVVHTPTNALFINLVKSFNIH